MRDMFANLVHWCSRYGLSLLAAGIVCFAVVMSVILLKLTSNQSADSVATVSEEAIRHAAQAETLLETKQSLRFLESVRRQPMTPRTRCQYLIALADMHRQVAELDQDDRDDAYHLGAARRLYAEALTRCATQEVRNGVRRGLVQIDVLEGQWDKAQITLERLVGADMPPAARAELQFLRCHCFREMGRHREAFEILQEVSKPYTGGPIYDQAQVLLAELMLAELAGRISADDVAEGRDESHELPLETQEIVVRVEALLIELLQRLSTEDVRRLRVLNGLLELYILMQDGGRAYETVRQIEGTTGNRDEQVRTYGLLAQLELQQRHPQEAEEAMRFCIEQFPQHKRTCDIRRKLFATLKKQGDLRKAIDVFDTLVRQTRDRQVRGELLAELMPGTPGSIVTALADSPIKQEGLKRLRKTLEQIHAQTPLRWLENVERLLFLKGRLAFESGDFTTAEEHFQRYLAEAPFHDFLEDVLYLDATAAVKNGASPAVRAYRAHRYLTRCSEGRYSVEIFNMLVKAYYDMKLFAENLHMAKTAFMHAVARTEEGSSEPLPLSVLQTAVLIAQCSSRLNNAEVAAPLFYRCAARIDELQLDPEFFLDWANAALQTNQKREAVRRLEVGSRRIHPGPQRDYLICRALAERIHLGLRAAVPTARAMLTQLRRHDDDTRHPGMLLLFEALLHQYSTRDPEQIAELLAEMHRDLPVRAAHAHWALRYLRQATEAGTSQQAVDTLRAVYAEAEHLPEKDAAFTHVRECMDHLDAVGELNEHIAELTRRGLGNE